MGKKKNYRREKQLERLSRIDEPSKLYDRLRPFVSLFHSLAYRRLIVKGTENIPKNTATVFAPNHQNALMDALGIVFTSGIQSVFLSRADIFSHPLVLRLLTFFKQMPVYRIRDGYKNLSKNDDTFERTSKVLINKRYLCLYPEAAHTGKRSFLPHKKAIPKIAFLAAEKTNFELDVKIVPVGVYYDDFVKFRGLLIIEYGKPINVSDFYDLYKSNPNKAIYQLRNRIMDDLSKTTINIKNKQYYNEIELLRQSYGNELRKNFKGERRYDVTATDIPVVEKIEAHEELDSEGFKELMSVGRKYEKALNKFNLQDEQFIGVSISKKLRNLLFAVLGLPFFVVGSVLNFIPFVLPRIVFKVLVRDKQLWRTFMFVFGLLFYPVWMLIVGVLVHLLTGYFVWAIALALLTIPIGVLAYESYRSMVVLLKGIRFYLWRKLHFKEYNKLLQLRQRALNMLNDIIK